MTRRGILMIGNYPPPYGGVPHHIERLSAVLSEADWDVHVLSGGTSGNTRIGRVNVYKPTYPAKLAALLTSGIRGYGRDFAGAREFSVDQPGEWRRFKLYAEIGSRIIRRYDIKLISAYNQIYYAPIGAFLARKYDIPLVISVFGELHSRPEFAKTHRSFIETIARCGTAVISCSDHCGASYKRSGIDVDYRVIPYGINVDHFSPNVDGSPLRRQLGFGDSFVVLFIGRMGHEMGLHTFIACIESMALRHDQVKYLIAGQKAELYDAAKRLQERFPGRVAVMADVPYETLPQVYAAADVVAIPTSGNRACSSLAAMEAMASGKSVIASRVGGIPEIVVDGDGGTLIPPESVSALQTAIMNVLNDSERDRARERARMRATRLFNERVCFSTIEDLFSRIESNDRKA